MCFKFLLAFYFICVSHSTVFYFFYFSPFKNQFNFGSSYKNNAKKYFNCPMEYTPHTMNYAKMFSLHFRQYDILVREMTRPSVKKFTTKV